jgi:hypothetical protein
VRVVSFFLVVFHYLLFPPPSVAQFFFHPPGLNPGLAMGGLTAACPITSLAYGQPAILGLSELKTSLELASSVPYGLTDWKVMAFRGTLKVSQVGAFGFTVTQNKLTEYSEQQYRLQYGRAVSNRLYLGGSLDHLRLNASGYGRDGKFIIALGMLAKLFPDFWMGCYLENPTLQRLGESRISANMALGICWMPGRTFMISSEVEKQSLGPIRIRLGYQYTPMGRFFFRAGIHTEPHTWSLGFGVRLSGGWQVESAAAHQFNLGITPAFTLRFTPPGKASISFKKSTKLP